jgi:hypothetical protein
MAALNDAACPKPLNRQAKIKGTSVWTDMGNVTLSDAAVKFAEQRNLVADTLQITVRDDEDKIEHELTVESFRAFRVSGLRGGAD